MSRFRASIAMMLAMIGLMAVGFAALRVSSRLWASVCVSAAILSVVVSIAAILYDRGSRRAFWVGFTLFGWPYLIFSLGPPPLNAWRDLLITSAVLSVLEDVLLDVPGPGMSGRASIAAGARRATGPFTELTSWTYWTATDRSNPFASDSFSRIGHSLFCLAIAVAGGASCQALRDARNPSSPAP